MVQSIKEMQPRPAIKHLAIGVFDGVHLGHREIIREALRDLQSATEAGVLTFEPHPQKFISREQAPPRLTTLEQKLHLLHAAGIMDVMVVEFNAYLQNLSAEEFVSELHRIFPGLVQLIVGPDWAFGRGRKGTAETMRSLGLSHGFFTRSLPPVLLADQAVSSTRIREAISRRAFLDADAMLGYSYWIEGVVVQGDRRGSEMGYPTANISNVEQLTPPPGVYAGRAKLDGKSYPAVMNYGYRPTISDKGGLLLEVHLFNFSGDIYGHRISVGDFIFIREEKVFQSVDELKLQISQDAEQAITLLSRDA